MDSVMKYITGFFGGLLAILIAVLPVSILWTVLTGGTVLGMDVVTNLTKWICRVSCFSIYHIVF